MPRNDRQYWYDAAEPRGRRSERRLVPRRGRRTELDPGRRAEDAGHGLGDEYPRRRDLPRGLPEVAPPAGDERHFGYGRERFYGDPYRTGEPGRRHEYGELYGRRERDFAHRRQPLYREPSEWRDESRGLAAGFEIESDFPEWEFEGSFTGVGPRGYRRSDERILDDVAERLALSADVDARHVRLAVDGGEVRLEGTVPERSLKFLIEDLAASVRGVIDVDNRLRVGDRAGDERPPE